LNCVAIPLL